MPLIRPSQLRSHRNAGSAELGSTALFRPEPVAERMTTYAVMRWPESRPPRKKIRTARPTARGQPEAVGTAPVGDRIRVSGGTNARNGLWRACSQLVSAGGFF